jgi:hypothetical protein
MTALISAQLRVSSAARSVTHLSALASRAARFLDLDGRSVVTVHTFMTTESR